MKCGSLARLLGIGLLTMSCLLGRGAVSQEAPRKIEITAKRFAYEPSEISLKKGAPVVLVLTSQDVTHGLKFKDLELDAEIKKGSSSEISFTPAKTGDFVGQCSRFCGAGHGSMELTIHVTE